MQHFLWYELPLKWITSLADRLDMAKSLARALDLLGLRRYAAVCRSPDTRRIFEMYDRDPEEGLAAFRGPMPRAAFTHRISRSFSGGDDGTDRGGGLHLGRVP
jgi:hypothetical protein